MKQACRFFAIFFAAAILLAGCQDQNSFSGDSDRYAPLSSDSSPSTCAGRLALAQAVFRSNCATCHSDYVTNTYRQWIDQNLLEVGDSEASPIFYRLRGSSVGNNQTMPPSGQLISADLETIRLWVDESTLCE